MHAWLSFGYIVGLIVWSLAFVEAAHLLFGIFG